MARPDVPKRRDFAMDGDGSAIEVPRVPRIAPKQVRPNKKAAFRGPSG